MRFVFGVILIVSILLEARDVFANSSCDIVFDASVSKHRDVNEILDELEKLPAIILDQPTLKEGIERLINDLADLRHHNEFLREVDQLLFDEKITEVEALAALEKHSIDLQLQAEELLAGSPLEGEPRRRAEGLKLLLRKSKNLKLKAEEMYKEKNKNSNESEDSTSEAEQNSELESSAENPPNGPSEKSAQDSKESAKNSAVKELDEKKAAEGLQEVFDQMLEEIKDQISDLKEKMNEEELLEKLNEEIDRQKHSIAQDKKSEDEFAKSTGESATSEKSESKDNELNSENEKSPQSDIELSEEIKNNYEDIKMQVEDLLASDVASEESKRAPDTREEMHEALDEFLHQIENSQEAERQEKQPEEQVSQKTKDSPASEKSQSKESAEGESQKREEGPEQLSEGKEFADESRSDFEESREDRDKETGSGVMPSKIDSIKDNNLDELFTPYVEMLWGHALKKYRSSMQLYEALQNFKSHIEFLLNHKPGVQALLQYRMKAINTLAQMQSTGVNYLNLKNYAQTISNHSQDQGVPNAVKLKFLKDVFDEIQVVSQLSAEEKDSLSIINQLLKGVSTESSTPTSEDFYKALSKHFIGPLSRKRIAVKYADGNGSIDFKKLEIDLKENKLNDILINSSLTPFLDLFKNSTNRPHENYQNKGMREAINDRDPELLIADEISRYEWFHRDIHLPLKTELALLFSGDMLEKVYKEPIKIQDPRLPIKKEASIVLLDVSTSMKNIREVLRDALVSSFLDYSFRGVASGSEHQSVYIIPFHSKPLEGETASTLKEAYSLFSRIKDQPYDSEGTTDIMAALEYAFDIVAAHQSDKKDFHKANILLITDGDDAGVTSQKIQTMSEKLVDPSKVWLNAITIGNQNIHIKDAIDSQITKNTLATAKYQHIGGVEADSLLKSKAMLEGVLQNAESISSEREVKFDSMLMSKFRTRMIKLQDASTPVTATAADLRKTINFLNQKTKRNFDGSRQVGKFIEIAIFGENLNVTGEMQKHTVLLEAIELLSKPYKVSVEVILQSLPQELKEDLKIWLKSN